MRLNSKRRKKLFYSMLRIRLIEETIAKKYSEGKMRCPTHLSIGQEAVAVGVCSNLSKKDNIVTAHRSHAHYLAKGGSLKRMISELYGKETGCAKGLGGSMHLLDLNAGVAAAVPIVGSTIPIGTGIAWAEKLKKKNNVIVIFFGDGATEEGVFFESLEFASLHNLKILFVCENNKYSTFSHISKRQYKERRVTKIAKSFGIKSETTDGNSLETIFTKSKKIFSSIKKNSRPYLIEFNTFRHLEHCGPNNDDYLNYREESYQKKWLSNCPIKKYKKNLIKHKLLSSNEFRNYEILINKEITDAFDFAEKSKFPEKKLIKKYIYA